MAQWYRGKPTMNLEQRRFVEAELFQLTLSAVTQRGGVYKPKLTEEANSRKMLALETGSFKEMFRNRE
jgi:hypothetical protein